MKLLRLNCPNCGAKLCINDSLKSFTCNFCGTTSLLDDEVIKVEHRIIDNKIEETIKSIDALLKIKKYDEAFKKAEKLVNEYPYEPRSWYNYIKCETRNFEDYNISLYEIEQDYENYLTISEEYPTDKKNIDECTDYIKKLKEMKENDDFIKEQEKYGIKVMKEVKDEVMKCPFCNADIHKKANKCYECGEALYWPDEN